MSDLRLGFSLFIGYDLVNNEVLEDLPMSSIVTRIESDRRVRIPDEWGEEFAAEHQVELVRCEVGILVRPLPMNPLQVALARKLVMNRRTHFNLADIDMDRFGW
jgi:hypothetical protein